MTSELQPTSDLRALIAESIGPTTQGIRDGEEQRSDFIIRGQFKVS